MSSVSNPSRLLEETRRVLEDARGLVEGAADGGGRFASQAGILPMYEALCRSLDSLDGERLRALLSRIAEHIEELNGLASDVERVRRLHKGLRES